MGHTVAHYSFHNKTFFSVVGDGGRWVRGQGEMSRIGVYDMKSTKNQYKVSKNPFLRGQRQSRNHGGRLFAD